MDLFRSRTADASPDPGASRATSGGDLSAISSPNSTPTVPRAAVALDERVAAVRVLRVLHSSPRRRVLVVQDERGAPRIVKHWARHDEAVDRELRALDRARGAHVVRLIDVGDDGDGVAAVLERAERGDLARLLRERTTISSGELVTIVAPLASAVARLHRAGVAHDRITAQRVLFDASGAPQLCGFGGAELFERGLPPAHLERLESVRRDRDALALLARSLAERITGGAGRRALDAVGRAAADPDDPLGRLSSELFAFSSGSPVRFPVGQETEAAGTPARPALDGDAAVSARDRAVRIDAAPACVDGERMRAPDGRRRQPRRRLRTQAGSGSGSSRESSRRARGERDHARRVDRRLTRSRSAASAPAQNGARSGTPVPGSRRPDAEARRRLLREILDGTPLAELRSWAVRAARAQSPRRRRAALAVGSAAAAALLAFLLVPGPSAAETPRAGADASNSRAATSPGARSSGSTPDRETATARNSDALGDESGSGSSSTTRTSVPGADDADEAVRGEDPLAAARVLLAARRDSLRDLDPSGLGRVLDAGSTAAADDRALLERLDAGSASAADRARVDLAAVEVGEQLGDAVVIRLAPNSDPASLLLIRGEAGWRIRAYSSAAG